MAIRLVSENVDFYQNGWFRAMTKLWNLKKNFDDLVEMLDYYNDEWDVKSEESFQHPLIFVPFFSLKIPSDTLSES